VGAGAFAAECVDFAMHKRGRFRDVIRRHRGLLRPLKYMMAQTRFLEIPTRTTSRRPIDGGKMNWPRYAKCELYRNGFQWRLKQKANAQLRSLMNELPRYAGPQPWRTRVKHIKS
jgi:hypothetical protein